MELHKHTCVVAVNLTPLKYSYSYSLGTALEIGQEIFAEKQYKNNNGEVYNLVAGDRVSIFQLEENEEFAFYIVP